MIPKAFNYDEATAVGQYLHDQWSLITNQTPPMDRDDLAWGDLVKKIITKARNCGSAA